mgnify:CR=1 FL=1
MNSAMQEKVLEFGTEIINQIFAEFEGEEIGSEECTKEMVIKSLFGKLKKKASAKKGKKTSSEKKRRNPSGYTLFQREMKGEFNAEIAELVASGEDKPKFISFAAKKWGEADKDEWNAKAKALAEEEKVKEEEEEVKEEEVKEEEEEQEETSKKKKSSKKKSSKKKKKEESEEEDSDEEE